MCWDMLVSVFTSYNCCGENGIGGGEASSDSKRGKKVEVGNESVNEGCGNEPALLQDRMSQSLKSETKSTYPSHDRCQKEK